MSPLTHRAFFGDAERDFTITPTLILELERNTGAGIGSLCARLFNRQFSHSDIIETIRLGLIGGGEKPQRASELVATYAQGRPIMETYPLAVSILHRLYFGEAQPEAPK